MQTPKDLNKCRMIAQVIQEREGICLSSICISHLISSHLISFLALNSYAGTTTAPLEQYHSSSSSHHPTWFIYRNCTQHTDENQFQLNHSLSLSPPSWNFTHYHELLRLQYRDPKTQDFGRHSRFGWDPFGHRSRIHHIHCIWRSGSFSFLCFSCASERATRSVFTEFLAKYGKTLNKEREEKREIGKTLKDSSTATVEDYDLPLTPDQFIEEIIPMYQQK